MPGEVAGTSDVCTEMLGTWVNRGDTYTTAAHLPLRSMQALTAGLHCMLWIGRWVKGIVGESNRGDLLAS
jgi:hypothetical protein